MLDDRKPDQYTVATPDRIGKDRYAAIVNKLKAILVDLERSDTYLASLNVLEATLSFVPPRPTRPRSSTSPLFDHLKLTWVRSAPASGTTCATGQKRLRQRCSTSRRTPSHNEKPSCRQISTSPGIQGLLHIDPFLGCRGRCCVPALSTWRC